MAEKLVANEFLVNEPNSGVSKLTSLNSKYQLIFLKDLTLIVRRMADNTVIWQGGTSHPGAGFIGGPIFVAYMQDDGNFVIEAQDSSPPEIVLFATNTPGNPGSQIEMQDDGNLVIYDRDHKPIWASNTDSSA